MLFGLFYYLLLLGVGRELFSLFYFMFVLGAFFVVLFCFLFC